MRHWLKDKMGEKVDDDSKLRHLAHEAWNALAVLDLALREAERHKVVAVGDSITKEQFTFTGDVRW
jgi:hypothetical protein